MRATPEEQTEELMMSGTAKLKAWERLPAVILAGPLRGMRWLPASGGKVTRILLGTYERNQTARFCDTVRPGDVVYDVGAALGYYTLLASRLVGTSGRVVAFEPFSRNAAFLDFHVWLNRSTNVILRQEAVGDRTGTTGFQCGTGTGTGRIAADGPSQVSLQTLDHVARETGLWPTHIKIDVEGAEADVLRGAESLLERVRPKIFLSTHGADVHEQCCRWLDDHGYALTPLDADDLGEARELLAVQDGFTSRRVA